MKKKTAISGPVATGSSIDGIAKAAIAAMGGESVCGRSGHASAHSANVYGDIKDSLGKCVMYDEHPASVAYSYKTKDDTVMTPEASEITAHSEADGVRLMEQASADCPDCKGLPCWHSAFRALLKAGYLRQPVEPVSLDKLVQDTENAFCNYNMGEMRVTGFLKAVLTAAGVPHVD